jgi:hypothetical protein
MSDLVERLRGNGSQWSRIMREAADEIERLRKLLSEERERCAQVAENNHCCGKEIAYAIRALKDES